MSQSPDDVHTFFKEHWTVRKYKSFTMPESHLDTILYAAQRAPTDATAQMYSIIRLTDPQLRKNVAKLSSNPHIETASEAFVICADLDRLQIILKSRGYKVGNFPQIALHFAIGDAVLAGQNMLIAAEMLGYRGCWIGGVVSAFNEISTLLKLPAGAFPFAALTLGVPDEEPKFRPRLERKSVIHENYYSRASEDPASSAALDRGVEAMAAITSRGDWAQTLAGYFAKDGTMEAREKLLSEFLKNKFFKSFE
jgi:nitroreductase